MRKRLFLVLVLSSLGLVSISGQTWDQFITRVNAVSEAVIQAMADPAYRIDNNNERIAAVLAAHTWCRKAYLHIANNAPDLTQQQRSWYIINANIHRAEEEKLDRILEYASTPTYNDIIRRYNNWGKFIDEGGIINFSTIR